MAGDAELRILITGKDDASKALNSVSASADKLGESHKSASKATEGLSSVTNELTGALRTVSPEMGNLASELQKVVGTASSGGLLGVAAAGALAGGALIALGMKGGQLLTELVQLSAVTGLNIERTDFWAKALSDVGGDAGSLAQVSRLLGNEIVTIDEALEKSTPLTAKSGAAFDLLGGSVRDSNNALLSGGAAMEVIIPKLAAIKDGNERARLGNEVFGRSWAAVAALVANYETVSASAERQTARFAKALGTDAEGAMVAYNTKMTDIKTTMEILELKAFPPVLALLDRMVTLLDRIASIGEIDLSINLHVAGLQEKGTTGDVASFFGKVGTFLGNPMALHDLFFGAPPAGTIGNPAGSAIGASNSALNSAPIYGPANEQGIKDFAKASASASAAYNAELEAKKQLEKETNDYLAYVRANAEATDQAAKHQLAYNEALESFNKEQGKAVQTFLQLSGINSAASALFGSTSREQADLRVRQAQAGLTTARFGDKSVHFGPGEGPGVAAKVDKQLKTIEAENTLLEARRVAANSLLITEQQRAVEGEKLVTLTANQSALIKDKLNPSITDLFPQLRTAASEYETMGSKISSGTETANTALLGFARALSEFKLPAFKAPPDNGPLQIPIVRFGGPAWDLFLGQGGMLQGTP